MGTDTSLARLTEIFRAVGAAGPESWAQSEIEEPICV